MTDGTRARIPRDPTNDYTAEAAQVRRAFASEQTGATLDHVAHFSQPIEMLAGNVENFIGVAQVPIGLAGPLLVHGEHAQGEYFVPLATTEGTLVASYNRGMRLLRESGGIKATVVAENMQRSPVFRFADALEARAFGEWVDEHFDAIRVACETTTRVGKLLRIMQFAVGPLRYLRFDYTTGDAAGQNMVGKATLAGCEWIVANHPKHPTFLLSGNIDTDKKHSAINTLLTRGKRVVAEATIPREKMRAIMGVDTHDLFNHRQVSMAGATLVGSANNGAHAANGLAALFIATGQDAANVAESHAAITYAQLRENGDYYWSVTLPSLIVATYGGGTGLGTQRECLELMDCYGMGKSHKFAEICAAVVLAGETSLTAAIVRGDWVSSHDRLGRNRP
jgi:hydroxymethylglutaryl-CoA reductase (NADPH)